MNVKCKCCGNKIDKDNAIRVPREKYNVYYCSARCFAKDLIVHSENSIADLNLTDNQIDKILDILVD